MSLGKTKEELAIAVAEALREAGFKIDEVVGEQIYLDNEDDLLIEIGSRVETFGW